MRTIKMIHEAEYRPIDDLITYSPLPSTSIQQVDPFLFLNHHGPQHYAPNNRGLPLRTSSAPGNGDRNLYSRRRYRA